MLADLSASLFPAPMEARMSLRIKSTIFLRPERAVDDDVPISWPFPAVATNN